MKVVRFLDVHLEECFMIVLLAIVTVVMIFQVFLRYVFASPLFWAEELCRYGLVWSTFVSIGYCIRHNLMLRMDSLDRLWPRKGKIVLDYALKIVSLAFLVILGKASYVFMLQTFTSQQRSAAMDIPVSWLHIIVFPAIMLGIFRMLQNIVLYTRDLRRQTKGAAVDEPGAGTPDEPDEKGGGK